MSSQLIERIVEIIETGQESRAGLARTDGDAHGAHRGCGAGPPQRLTPARARQRG